MHDWQELIRKKLAGVAMSRSERESLIAELSNHLEDTYGELLASGVAEPEAFAQCIGQLTDVHQIAAAARRAQIGEGAMNRRSKTLWLPGFVTLTLASVSLMALQLFSFSRPQLHWANGRADVAGLVWLLSLLPCGALGAYLCRRAGGSRWNSITASLFPSLVMLAVWCLILPIGAFIERNTYIIHHPRYFGLALVLWVIVPGIALFLGALPVLRTMNNADHVHRDAPRPVA